MSDSSKSEDVATFVDELQDAGEAVVEIVVPVDTSRDGDRSTLRLLLEGEQVQGEPGESVRLRLPSDSRVRPKVAEAEWADDGVIRIDRIRTVRPGTERMGSGMNKPVDLSETAGLGEDSGMTDGTGIAKTPGKGPREFFRISAPSQVVAYLAPPGSGEEDDSVEVEPLDLSLGGIGLASNGETEFRVGDRVQVGLNIPDKFADVLGGRVAHATTMGDGTLHLGVEFDELEAPTIRALSSALDDLFLEVINEM